MINWTKQDPSVYNFTGTDGNGGDYIFTLTRSGSGPAFTASLQKEGSGQGTIDFDNIQAVKDLFGAVAASIP